MLDVLAICRWWRRRRPRSAMPICASGCSAMMLDYVLGGAVAVIVLAYLVYALVRPERF